MNKNFRNNKNDNSKFYYVKKKQNTLEKLKQRIKKKSEGESKKTNKNDMFSKLNGFLDSKNKEKLEEKKNSIKKEENSKISQTPKKEKESINIEIKEKSIIEEEMENSSIKEKSEKSENSENEGIEIKLKKRDIEIQTEEICLKKVKLSVNSFEKRNLVQNLIKLDKVLKDIKKLMSKDQLKNLSDISIRNRDNVG